ncbi:MAG: tyrosine-type recombinase/integrase [Hydrogeniiclostridium mannosilyticum]
MQKDNMTVGQWCGRWFTANRHKWNGNTEGGYRNLIYSHILPGIGRVEISDLTEQAVADFYDSLQNRGLSARSVWCVHLLLRRCMDEAAQEQLISYNPVRLCQEPNTEEYKTAPLRLGQLQRYLNAAEKLGVLPLTYTGLSSGLRQCELLTLSWVDFHVRCRYILKGQRLLTLNAKAAHLLKQIPETDSPYVFLNPKSGAPYKLHEFYYLHKKILKQARLPWVAFRDLQRQFMEVGI